MGPSLPRTAGTMAGMPTKVLLAAPRGYCAGVERAVDAVERALQAHGTPVYVRKQIVHNLHVVARSGVQGRGLRRRGDRGPRGRGRGLVGPRRGARGLRERPSARDLTVIDATCPLVTKVHLEARRFADEGRTIVLIGHAGHEEVVGTTGQAPERRPSSCRTSRRRARVEIPERVPLSYLTQTTLSVDETNEIVGSSASGSRRSRGRRARTSATRPRTARTR